MSLSNNTCDFEHLKSIIAFDTPLVLFDKIAKLFSYSKVTIQDKKAAYDAINYPIKKIAYSRKSYLPQNAIDSLFGYKKALEDNGISYYSSIVFVGDNSTDFWDGYDNDIQIINKQLEIDAIFAVTDLMVTGIIKYFNKTGISIPQWIAVLGSNNWFMSSLLSPKLLTIDQPVF